MDQSHDARRDGDLGLGHDRDLWTVLAPRRLTESASAVDMIRSTITTASRIALSLLAAVAISAAARSLWFGVHEIDFWWHLAIGRFMAENRTFFRSDVFSHTAAGAPWVNYYWLGQLVFHAFWKLGGETGIVALRIGA